MASSVPSSTPSSGVIQGLLSALAPWFTGGAPSGVTTQYGGPSLLGAELLANSGPPTTTAARLGNALLGAQQVALKQASQRQALAQQNIGLQKSAMMLPVLQAYYRAATGGVSSPQSGAQPASGAMPAQGAPSPQSGAPSQPVAAASSAVPPAVLARRNAQPAAPAGAPRPSLPGLFSAPTPAQIASTPVGGMSPQMLSLGGLLSGQSPLATAQQIRQQQLAIARQRYAPAIAQLDTVRGLADPAQAVAASPGLMATWQTVAPKLGMNPQRDFNAQNVRTALTFARNQLAGGLSEATVAPVVPLQTRSIGLGGSIQVNPVTGKITTGAPQQQTAMFVGTDGKPVLLPKAEGIAKGLQPFNAETYLDPSTVADTAKLIADYDMAPLSGYVLSRPQGQAIMAEVHRLNPDYDASQYVAKQAARTKFTSGKQGDTVRSLSVATSHLQMLSDAAHALAQHDTPALNKLVNAFGVHVTGANPQTNFDAMKDIVGDEVVKAIVGTGGAEGDREAIKESFNAARSPAQIEGVIDKYEGLMGGQLRGLRRQYQKATGLHDFDSFVSSLARQQLNSAANSALGTQSQPRPLNIGQSATVGQFTVTRVR